MSSLILTAISQWKPFQADFCDFLTCYNLLWTFSCFLVFWYKKIDPGNNHSFKVVNNYYKINSVCSLLLRCHCFHAFPLIFIFYISKFLYIFIYLFTYIAIYLYILEIMILYQYLQSLSTTIGFAVGFSLSICSSIF